VPSEEVLRSDYIINEDVLKGKSNDEVLKEGPDNEALREGSNDEVLREGFDNEAATIEEEFGDDDELLYEEEFGDGDELLYEEEFDNDELLNEEEFVDNNGNESDEIVDKPLSSEQMPHDINGEFAPYFKNVTEALMFCWIQKHKICKNQFNDLFCHF